MPTIDQTSKHIKLDEKNHVEEPFLKQLEGLGWDVIRLEQKQNPQDRRLGLSSEAKRIETIRKKL